MTPTHSLSIDIETFSSVDLAKSGVYKYVESPDFEILMIAYSVDGSEPVVISKHDDDCFLTFKKRLLSADYLKTAHNAAFEMACLAKAFKVELDPAQWDCTMVRASMLGLPHSLDQVAQALKVDQQKDAAGKSLIRYFCVSCKPTTANGGRTRNLPHHNPEKWEQFKRYCAQDVRTEMAIRRKVAGYKIPEMERRLWALDQQINRRGIMVDAAFVQAAIAVDAATKEAQTRKASDLTGLDNPNSAAQLKAWITGRTGSEVEKLTKDAIPELLEGCDDPEVLEMLGLRQEMAKTSVKKYAAMLNGVCQDSRVRGLLQYYGANRTGRWAGRLVQVQNLPKNSLSDLDRARQIVATADSELVEMMYGNVPDTLSQLIRTAFVAPDGHRFIVADFAAIEARVLAWLAGERWRMDVFATHGKIYEASAAQMFHVPIETIAKGQRNYDLRAKGKVAELALGYQGGPNALIKMGALKMGIPEEELPRLVKMWRNANRRIVQFWDDCQSAAIRAAQGEKSAVSHGITFHTTKSALWITLPSGRHLVYQNPRLVAGKFGGEALQYDGMDQTTKKWGRQDTYGGKLVENITQAVARDCLADAMLRLDKVGHRIVCHVHDEVILEVPEGMWSCAEIDAVMGMPIPWAKGLPLKAESYETKYYKKD